MPILLFVAVQAISVDSRSAVRSCKGSNGDCPYRRCLRQPPRRRIVPRSGCNLKGDLYQGSWVVLDEDDMAQSRPNDGLEMSLPHACSVSVFDLMLDMHLIRIPPTPAAGLTTTSMAASSGNSSLLWTSMGPLTAPIMEYPFQL